MQRARWRQQHRVDLVAFGDAVPVDATPIEEQGTVLVLFKQRSRVKNRNTELISVVILANLPLELYCIFNTNRAMT